MLHFKCRMKRFAFLCVHTVVCWTKSDERTRWKHFILVGSGNMPYMLGFWTLEKFYPFENGLFLRQNSFNKLQFQKTNVQLSVWALFLLFFLRGDDKNISVPAAERNSSFYLTFIRDYPQSTQVVEFTFLVQMKGWWGEGGGRIERLPVFSCLCSPLLCLRWLLSRSCLEKAEMNWQKRSFVWLIFGPLAFKVNRHERR